MTDKKENADAKPVGDAPKPKGKVGRPRKNPDGETLPPKSVDAPAPPTQGGADVQRKEPASPDEVSPPPKESHAVATADASKDRSAAAPKPARSRKSVTPRPKSKPDAGKSESDGPDYTPYLILLGGGAALAIIYLLRREERKKTGGTENGVSKSPLDSAGDLVAAAWEQADREIVGVNDKLQMLLGKR